MASRQDPDDDARVADLCDYCGRVLTEQDDPLLDLLPDSSCVHARNPAMDGRRLVIACSREHLAALQEEYRRRPFAEAELNASKIERVLHQHRRESDRLSLEELAAAAGLSVEQVQRAVKWLSARHPGWLDE